jgi:hypothetical protein
MANYGQLALRDPALAALLGALPGSDFGSEFGTSADDGQAYGMHGQAGVIPDRGADIGAEFGAEFGYYGYGADVAPPAMPHMAQHMAHRGHAPIHPEHAQLLRAHHHRQHQTEVRERLLEPNKGSTTKVERYDFSLNQTLTIGTPVVVDMSLQPSVTLRPQRLICNAPAPGFVSFLTIQVANVAVTVGNATDAYSYSAVAVGSHLDCPTLSPANRATLAGTYSGYSPVGYAPASLFLFVSTFQGPATIVA